MWPFSPKPKRHLCYDSVREWMVGERVPENFFRLEDPALRDKYITEYGELRRHLFEKHIRTLPETEQELFKTGRHPSESHRFAAQAEPYAERLQRHLESLGEKVAAVRIGFYHCDRIVLSVDLEPRPRAIDLETLPWLFEGFEIKYWVDPNQANPGDNAESTLDDCHFPPEH